MNYKAATIYFMSGTGNSYRAAAWMGESAVRRGVEARVIPVDKGIPEQEIKEGPAHLLGLVMPAHGFTAPWYMIRFALELPRRRGSHAFVALTRGGLKFGPVFTPGMEGTGAYLIALILLLKGYCVRGVMGLDMPSNWMSLHWGLHPKNSGPIIARNRSRAIRFIERIIYGKSYWGGIIPLLLGLALLPISLVYLFAGRFFLAKLFFASYRCTGCGLCVQNCLTGALKMSGKRKRRPYWTFSCESCMRCMGFCPVGAVEAGHSWGVILYYITAIPAADYLLNRLAGDLPWLAGFNDQWITLLLQYPFLLISIYLSYLLFNALIRIPAVNRIFTHTTFTHIYRRYHEPDTSLKDLRGTSGKRTQNSKLRTQNKGENPKRNHHGCK